MSLGNLVPRENGSGSLGTTEKRWASVYSNTFIGDGSGLTGVVGSWNGIYNGNAIITGSLLLTSSGVITPILQLDTSYSSSGHVAGRFTWDDINKTAQLDLSNEGVKLQIGQEIHIYARNNSGQLITNGMAVRISGATGNKVTIEPAIAKTGSLSVHTENEIIGIATQDISNNALGYVTTFGTVRGINTLGLTEGSVAFLSHTTAGQLVNTPPPAPFDVIRVAVVERVNDIEGQLFVTVRPSIHMTDITGVSTGSVPPNGVSYWQYDSNTKLTTLTNNLSGSFTGSFVGNGAGLTGITATAEPAGSDGAIQFNKSGVTSGSTSLTYNYTNNVTSIQSGVKHKTYRLTASVYNVQVNDYRIGVPYTKTGSATIYLPDCQLVQGQEFSIKDEGGNATINNIVIQPSGSQSIDGQSNAVIAVNYTSIKIYNDNNNWFIE